MFEVFKKELVWAGRKLTLETGKIARQADAAVVVTYGETKILATVVGQKEASPNIDFFPLTVNYQERSFAAGKIPGGFFRREGRPSEKEILISRLIDRPIRPLFLPEFRNETQVVCTLLSHDLVNEPDIVAMIAASAALTLSGLPFLGPIGACRVGVIGDQFVLNPTLEQIKESKLDLVVAGTAEGVMMVESEAKELDEKTMLAAVTFGHQQSQAVIQAIIDLAEKCAKDPWDIAPEQTLDDQSKSVIRDKVYSSLGDAYSEPNKSLRQKKISELKKSLIAWVEEQNATENKWSVPLVKAFVSSLEEDIVRGRILKSRKRIDGRDEKTVRSIVCEAGFLPRVHGSALFTRGETQALVVATLGTGDDEQIIDAIEGEYKETFMLHYNFPPYSVGEVGRMSGPGRREIGHGKLAWRAIRPMLPSKAEFPYTLRVVSEITESNGSSSMATVCGASLALMDAGVPLKSSVAGIAMGLIKEGDDYVVLSDIMGDEDHLGDMDFKVAGTETGITALQMDIKIPSITENIMRDALAQAHKGRMEILSKMNGALNAPREKLNDLVPQIVTIKINPDKIREVIGSGGKVIREICESTGSKIDIEQDGRVQIASANGAQLQRAIDWVMGIAAEPEIGKTYDGTVVKIVDFGAFVRFMGAREGLVHVSEIAHERIENVSDVLKVGDALKVKVLGVDHRGKVKLSHKSADSAEDNNQKVEATSKKPGSKAKPAKRAAKTDESSEDKPRRRKVG